MNTFNNNNNNFRKKRMENFFFQNEILETNSATKKNSWTSHTHIVWIVCVYMTTELWLIRIKLMTMMVLLLNDKNYNEITNKFSVFFSFIVNQTIIGSVTICSNHSIQNFSSWWICEFLIQKISLLLLGGNYWISRMMMFLGTKTSMWILETFFLQHCV